MLVPLTIDHFLDRASLVYGDRSASVDEPGTAGSFGTMSYRELGDRAKGMGKALEEMGIKHGQRVAIVSPNSSRMLTAFYGVSAYGRVLVPINYRLNAAEIQYIVDHSEASVLLVDPELDEALGAVTAKERIVLDGVADRELFARLGSRAAPSWEPDENATASINYTSGTTALPKGVELTHRNCWLAAAIFGWHVTVTDRDVYLHTLPMFHCNGWAVPFAATAMGCAQIMLRKVDGPEILRRVAVHGVTLMCGAPALLTAVLDAAARCKARGEEVPGRGRVRVVVAGAPPPSTLIARLETELGWEFIQAYGLTETALVTINRARPEWDSLPMADRAQRLTRAGVPAVGIRVNTGQDAEILVQSNPVFAGYWHQPTESATAMEGGWFHSGDCGAFDDDGYLVISDRKKDVIISGGENVSAFEVENCLCEYPGVAEVAVIGTPSEKWGETVTAIVVRLPNASIDEHELIEFARTRLAHFKCPTSVEFRESLTRTETGKLQKSKLRQPYWEGRDRLTS